MAAIRRRSRSRRPRRRTSLNPTGAKNPSRSEATQLRHGPGTCAGPFLSSAGVATCNDCLLTPLTFTGTLLSVGTSNHPTRRQDDEPRTAVSMKAELEAWIGATIVTFDDRGVIRPGGMCGCCVPDVPSSDSGRIGGRDALLVMFVFFEPWPSGRSPVPREYVDGKRVNLSARELSRQRGTQARPHSRGSSVR